MFVVIFVSGVLDVNYYSINVARGAGKFVTSVSWLSMKLTRSNKAVNTLLLSNKAVNTLLLMAKLIVRSYC